jgi:hypothetical protein
MEVIDKVCNLFTFGLIGNNKIASIIAFITEFFLGPWLYFPKNLIIILRLIYINSVEDIDSIVPSEDSLQSEKNFVVASKIGALFIDEKQFWVLIEVFKKVTIFLKVGKVFYSKIEKFV